MTHESLIGVIGDNQVNYPDFFHTNTPAFYLEGLFNLYSQVGYFDAVDLQGL